MNFQEDHIEIMIGIVFLRDLGNQNWNDYHITHNPADLWNICYENILRALNPMCPLKKFKIKKFKELWVSNNILEMIKDKDAALKKAKRTKDRNDWVLARRPRNDCVNVVRRAKPAL